MQILLDSKHLADEKMLDLQSEKIVSSLKADKGSGENQYVRISLIIGRKKRL